MRVLLKTLSWLLAIFFVAASTNCTTTKDYAVRVPSFKDETLNNGLRFVEVQDQSLPVVGIMVMVTPGSTSDPDERSGVTTAVAEVMEKGTVGKSANGIADAFARFGSDFSGVVEQDYVVFQTEALSGFQNQVFDLFKEVVFEPSFPKAEVELFKQRMIEMIRRQNDDANEMADIAFVKTVLKGHPYARGAEGEIRDIRKLERTDLVRRYDALLRPRQMTVVLSGDFSSDLAAKARKVFSNLSRGAKDSAPDGAANAAASVSATVSASVPPLTLVHRPGLQQTQIRMGHLAIPRNHPDYWPVQVANIILGGSFTSRLMKAVRVDRGLTYSIRASTSGGVLSGPFSVSTFTRNDKVGESLTVIKDVLSEFQKKGVTPEELRSGKNYLKGHLIRAFEKPEDLVKAMVRMRIYGLTEDEIKNIVQRVESVTLEQINDVIGREFRSDDVRIVIYTDKEAVKSQLDGALRQAAVVPYDSFL
jgi:zinc protease